MDVGLAAALTGISFLVGVIATALGAGWRIRSAIDTAVDVATDKIMREMSETMKNHFDSEHGKDSGGKTLRERVILLESGIQSMRRSIERRHDRDDISR